MGSQCRLGLRLVLEFDRHMDHLIRMVLRTRDHEEWEATGLLLLAHSDSLRRLLDWWCVGTRISLLVNDGLLDFVR